MATKNDDFRDTVQIRAFRVRAVDSVHIFYGDESPVLEGKMLRLSPGQEPVEIPASMAEYFVSFPGLRVDAIPETTPS
jgi:hypothetical protein